MDAIEEILETMRKGIWSPTLGIRWHRDHLQQMWREEMTGKIEWRDIPVVEKVNDAVTEGV